MSSDLWDDSDVWDESADSPISPEQMRKVAAHWKDTTQLSNALDAGARMLEERPSYPDLTIAFFFVLFLGLAIGIGIGVFL